MHNTTVHLDINRHLIAFCTTAVFLYALTKLWIGSKTSIFFEAAFLLPFYYVVFKNWKQFKKSKLTWICIAMLSTPALQFCILYMQNPELALKYQGIDKLFKLTFFIAAAFWISHNTRLSNTFLAANIISLGCLVIAQPNLIAYINHTLNGARPTLGDINPQFMATYCGLAIITTCCLISNMRKTNKLIITLGLITLFTAVFLFAGGQTRAAYLGIAACIPTLVISILLHQHTNLATIKYFLKSKPKLSLALALIASLTVISILQSNVINRIKTELSELNTSSIESIKKIGGGRGELTLFAAHKIWQQPLLGYGGESRKEIIGNAPELSHTIRKHLLHLHNSWLDFGLAYGLPGMILLALFIGYLISLIFKEWQYRQMPTHIATLGLLGITFLVVVNLFESYFFFWQGGYLLTWTLTPALAYYFKRKFRL